MNEMGDGGEEGGMGKWGGSVSRLKCYELG